MTVLNQLAAFAATASIADAGETDRAIQRRHVADAVIAGMVGHSTEDARALRPLFGDRPIGYRAAATRLTEIDDIHCPSCTTPSSAIVPAALNLVARDDAADPAALADAIWVGTEILARLGTAIRGAWIVYQGVWPTYFCAPAGVAATAGRLLGLDAAAMTNALAIALNMSAGGVGAHDAHRAPRWLLFATAVEAGVLAARAAREGFGGDPGLLDGPDWLRRTHGIAFDAAALMGGIVDRVLRSPPPLRGRSGRRDARIGAQETPYGGRTAADPPPLPPPQRGRETSVGPDPLGSPTIYRTLSLKPYCSAKQAIAAVEAFRRLLVEGINPPEIEAVEVRVPPVYAGMVARTAARGNRISTMISAAYQMALAAHRPDVLYDVARSDTPFDPAVMDLAARVTVTGDESLTDGFPECYPAVIAVLAGGRRYERRVTVGLGDPRRPLDDAALADKLRRIARPVLFAADVGEWIGQCGVALADGTAARALAERYDRQMNS